MHVLGTEHTTADCERLLQERERACAQTHPLVGPADDRQHLGLQLWLIRELARDALGAAVEQVPDGGVLAARVAIRIGAGKEPGQELAHFRGLVGLQPGAIAFRLQLHRVEGHHGRHEHDDGRRGSDDIPVASHELGRAIEIRVRTRGDRLVVQEPAQVIGELGGRRVAFRRILFQRLAENGVEIAARACAAAAPASSRARRPAA